MSEQPRTNGGAAVPYLLYLHVGDDALPAVSDATIVDLTPASAALEDVVAALGAAGLTAADLRTRTLFIAGSGPVARALAVYAAVCGFAGRLLDVSDLSDVLDVRSLAESPIPVDLASRPEVVDEEVAVSVAELLAGVPVDAARALHFAKRAVLTGADAAAASFEALVLLAALRRRGHADRLPSVAADGAVLDLETYRREGAQSRRSRRIDDRDSVVPAVARTDRQERLVTAAGLDLAAVLARLGSLPDPATGFFRCPRPERHRNGDATPSARLGEQGFRCFRCDAEQVDALRLVMDVKGIGPDAAADWLLAG